MVQQPLTNASTVNQPLLRFILSLSNCSGWLKKWLTSCCRIKGGHILQTRGRKRGHVHVQDRNFHLKSLLEWNFWLQLAQSTLSAHANAGGVQRGFRFSVGLGPRLTKNTVCSRPGLTHQGRKEENEPTEQKKDVRIKVPWVDSRHYRLAAFA